MNRYLIRLLISLVVVVVSFGIVSCSDSSNDTNNGTNPVASSNADTIYTLAKDENNKIIIEKYVDVGLIVSQMEDSRYTKSLILLDSDTSPIVIKYNEYSVDMEYRGNTDSFLYVDSEEPGNEEDPTIDDQYYGIWYQEQNDGEVLLILYIYSDKAMMFLFAPETGTCIQYEEISDVLEVPYYVEGLGMVTYSRTDSYINVIENACGLYATNNRSSVRSPETDELENNFGSVVRVMQEKWEWFNPWERGKQLLKDGIAEVQEKLNRMRGKVSSDQKPKDAVIEDMGGSYQELSQRLREQEIEEFGHDLYAYEQTPGITDDNIYRGSSIKYTESDEEGNTHVVKIITHDEDNKRVETIPIYDASGKQVSTETRSDFNEDGSYNESSDVPVTEVPLSTEETCLDGLTEECISNDWDSYLGIYTATSGGDKWSLVLRAEGQGLLLKNAADTSLYTHDLLPVQYECDYAAGTYWEHHDGKILTTYTTFISIPGGGTEGVSGVNTWTLHNGYLTISTGIFGVEYGNIPTGTVKWNKE